MAGKLRTFFRDQPFLAGCLGFLCMGAFMACGLVGLAVLGVGSCASCVTQEVGLDSMFGTIQDAIDAGFSLEVNATQEASLFVMNPVQPREVSCEELGAVLIPHVLPTVETVRVESTSYTLQDSGEIVAVPLECTWSGYPGREGTAAP